MCFTTKLTTSHQLQGGVGKHKLRCQSSNYWLLLQHWCVRSFFESRSALTVIFQLNSIHLTLEEGPCVLFGWFTSNPLKHMQLQLKVFWIFHCLVTYSENTRLDVVVSTLAQINIDKILIYTFLFFLLIGSTCLYFQPKVSKGTFVQERRNWRRFWIELFPVIARRIIGYTNSFRMAKMLR